MAAVSDSRMYFYVVCLVTLLSLPSGVLLAQDVTVEQLNFRGNKALSSKSLYSAIKTKPRPWQHRFLFWRDALPYQEAEFLNDLLRIEKLYHEEGFLEAQILDYTQIPRDGDERIDITVDIEEGLSTTVTQTLFVASTGDSLPLPSQLLHENISLVAGKRYREIDLRADYNTIVTLFSNRGYPYIEARVKPTIDSALHTVVLTWILSTGPYCTFGPLTFTGNTGVSENVIRRGIEFSPGDRFEQHRLLKAQNRIYALSLFNSVVLRTSAGSEYPPAIPIEVVVTERDRRALRMGVGFGSEEALRVSADWTIRNLIGGARSARIELKHATRVLPLHAAVVLTQPYFLDDQNDISLRPFYIWQDERGFEARRLGLEVNFTRHMTEDLQLFTTARVERDTVRVKGTAFNSNLNNLYNKSIVQVGLIRTTTDDPFSPARGSLLRLTAEKAGIGFNSKFRYYKLWGEYRAYRSPSPSTVLAMRVMGGFMEPIGTSPLTPVEERFFSGGSNSVRGWQRQQLGPETVNGTILTPTGGNGKLEGGIEIRYPLIKGLGGVLFLDGGNVWTSGTDLDPRNQRYALGSGLRYRTPIGPLRFDVARKLNKQRPNERRYQVHVSIGQAF